MTRNGWCEINNERGLFFYALPHELENPTGSSQTDTPNPTWINNLSIGFRGWFSKFWNIHSDKRTWQGNIAHFFIFGLDMVMFHDHVGLRLGRQQLGRGDKTDQPVDDLMDPYVLNFHQQPISLADVHISLPLFFLSYCSCLIQFFGCLNRSPTVCCYDTSLQAESAESQF